MGNLACVVAIRNLQEVNVVFPCVVPEWKSFHIVKGSETLVNFISQTKIDVKDVKSKIWKLAPNSEKDISHITAGELDCPASEFIKDFLITFFKVELKEEPIEPEQPKDAPISAMDVLLKAQRSFSGISSDVSKSCL